MSLVAWTSARFAIPLPDGHRFPIAKYELLRQRVLADGLVTPSAMLEPDRAPADALARVHDGAYLARVAAGTMPPAEQRRLGFPWSDALAERSLRAAGGTLEAAFAALERGVTMNLAGGTHHAFRTHGEGFCVFNDVAVAVRALQAARRIERAVIIDLDVHQGNGTHAIFAEDPSVTTFSMHGRRNYPFHKVAGTYDVELGDGTRDDPYLAQLRDTLPSVLAQARADIAFYLAGADPHEGDRLGRLGLTFDGLAARDHFVLTQCREIGLPVVITIAGGYGARIEDTVAIHATTARIAREFC
ncbi:MAG: histone deacetylase [Gemmatimonadaceae bacterium]|nr:histone deacetylase [Gemmatimonadaceae bacterium]